MQYPQKVVLGARVCSELKFDCAGQQQRRRVVRPGLDERVDQFTRTLKILLCIGEVSAQIDRQRMLGRELFQLIESRHGLLGLAALQKQRDQRAVRGQEIRLDLDRLAVCRRGLIAVATRSQKVALELPGFMIVSVGRQQLADQRHRTVHVALRREQASLRNHRGRKPGRGRQGTADRHLGRRAIPQTGIRRTQRHRQICLLARRGKYRRTVFVHHLLELALHDQAARESGCQLICGVLQGLGLAQFDLRSHRVAAFEQGFAQQKAPLRQLRILLQRVLDLNDRRLGILLRKVGLCRREQRLG